MSENLYTESQLESLIIRLRSARSHWIVYKEFVRTFGLSEGCFLSYLLNKLDFWQNRKNKAKDGWFYCKVESVTSQIGMSRGQQLRVIARLKKRGVIAVKVKGCPPKRYFHIDPVRIEILCGSIGSNKPYTNDQCTDLYKRGSVLIDKHGSGSNHIRVEQKEVERQSRTSIRLADARSDTSPATVRSKKTLVHNSVQRENPSQASLRSADDDPENNGEISSSEKISVPRPRKNLVFPERVVRRDSASRIRAEKLREGFRKNRVPVTNKHAVAEYIKSFDLLAAEVESADIDRVLDWYCENMNAEFVPKAMCGKSFRAKFAKIQAAMKRGSVKVAALPEEIKSLSQTISKWRWPKNSEKFVQKGIAVFWTNYQNLKAKLREKLQLEKEEWPSQKMFIRERILETYLTTPNTFITRWMKSVQEELKNWQDWSGSEQSFMGMMFSTKHKKFLARLADISIEWCGSTRYSELILRSLDEG